MEKPLNTASIVPASGISLRFGGEKLLYPIDGTPMIRRTVLSIVESRVFDKVLVITRPDLKKTFEELLDFGCVEILENRNHLEGISSSIREGLRALKTTGASEVGIILGDLPFLKPETIRLVYEEFLASRLDAAFPTYKGKRGHPFISRLGMLLRLEAELKGDRGLKGFFPEDSPRVRVVPVHDPGVIRDIDRPF